MVPHLIVMTKSNRNWYSRDFKVVIIANLEQKQKSA